MRTVNDSQSILCSWSLGPLLVTYAPTYHSKNCGYTHCHLRPCNLPTRCCRRHGINCDEQIPVSLVVGSAGSCLPTYKENRGIIPLLPQQPTHSVEGRYTVLRTIARLRTTEPSTRPHFRHLITSKQLLSFGSALALVSYGSVFIRVFNSFNADQI
ncbi:hypothetical protein FOIG_00485 [Fusarium odoratissimum NRRL 54006]|uniref:Uncharacterized protein n=2 Tax=Fusarium oxysporum species complex TaxID=171631 RepID=X0KA42_FUSO5|nr:uncharacterized protein FOIG_00485 [Fusarium odoratissimum NRRL 54006]EXM10313.1 hypothetical protein FOIG_00485 [Fusarium odoratissimum NRRL 54006]TXC05282.1 hypothetical protein FocTR4_00001670 [Fusarium oxysporum f. sp. cubense]